MTISEPFRPLRNSQKSAELQPAEGDPDIEMVSVDIDGTIVSVPKGTLLIRAAELMGVQIPRFCDHPLLEPVGACRQCLVEVEGQRKPVASCTATVVPDMVVRTQLTSEIAARAQSGVMELLLINHPLDCPVCDKGGECPLQNQAMSAGRTESRFTDDKRTFRKPIPLSSEVLLDRERCVLCARCTRFSQQIAGDPFIELLERGALEQVGIADGEPFESYFSGNTVQICPVGALTGAAYRFRARPFDLVSNPSVCEHCASGCAQRTDHRRGKVLRRLAGDDPEVNEEWNCDKGRWAFSYARQPDRITSPMVRDGSGALVEVSWPQAIDVAAAGLSSVLAGSERGVLTGGRVTLEDAYAYVKFARMTLNTNNIDFRARTSSGEEEAFLTALVAGTGMAQTYAALEAARVIVLVGFEPEEESPIVFLRIRKAVRKHGAKVITVAPFLSNGAIKLCAELIPTAPGSEAATLAALEESAIPPGALILVGERLAASPGALSAVARLARVTGAGMAWVPRRAGERGALEAGALPGLLPGGHPVSEPSARAHVARHWGVATLPELAGRDTDQMLSRDQLGAYVVGGVEIDDLPDPSAAAEALTGAFVVSLEMRTSTVTDFADVVLPVAAVAEKSGSFLNWEGRLRSFDTALADKGALDDRRVLAALAQRMGQPIGLAHERDVYAELAAIGQWTGPREVPASGSCAPPEPGAGEAILATWRMLLDMGRMQDGEDFLAGTAHPAVVRLSPDTARRIGAGDGELVKVHNEQGSITLPLSVCQMPDSVVWVPMRSPGSQVHRELGPAMGRIVRIEAIA